MSKSDVSFKDLKKAIDWSIRQLETPRQKRVEAVKQYVGSHYATQGAEKRVPTNFLELAVTIYTRQLAAQAPRALVTTGNASLRPFARNTEIALNQVPDEINLGATLRRAVLEALFSMGIVKVGICSTGVKILDHDYGESYVDVVNLDDYFCDMSAKSRAGIQYEGNDYWVPVDAARALYEGKSTDIEPDQHTVTGDQGEARAEAVTTDEGADLYKEKVWLRDVWTPKDNKLVTYGVKSLKLFNSVDWDGPEHGPYHMLGYSDVPGNLLPLPPVSLWRDLHELGNSLFRKLGRQADAKKTVAAFQGGSDADVEALKNAADGEGIRISGPKLDNVVVGGIDAPTLAFYLQIQGLFSYFAGNLDSMGGLAPMTDTVGQDKLLNEAASARLDHMREQTINFTKGIFKSLAWYEWTDPVRERIIEKPVPGTDITVRRVWSEATREGDFLEYNFDIDAYSMQDNTPSTKLQRIGMALERFVFPALPMLEQQGGQVDFQSLLSLVGRLGNVPELQDIVKFQTPDEGTPIQEAGASKPAAMPANTNRTYTRVSRPGASRRGKEDTLSKMLMGGNVQPAEAAVAGRQVS